MAQHVISKFAAANCAQVRSRDCTASTGQRWALRQRDVMETSRITTRLQSAIPRMVWVGEKDATSGGLLRKGQDPCLTGEVVWSVPGMWARVADPSIPRAKPGQTPSDKALSQQSAFAVLAAY